MPRSLCLREGKEGRKASGKKKNNEKGTVIGKKGKEKKKRRLGKKETEREKRIEYDVAWRII